ncbi:PIR Superfamily Protein [Plasmodium ovale wallikeri]|uniref:PIR Superfamily Protein n=1 Tax=Plasmodium ovale wallikeri TaxID=864142 RepID=A0A1A9AK42_PLAOA|nr:PIR Superfamily Protein [Plasmodium ovale wallikeri]SBT56586.1 PIR Superfamily Protein [Plasmodium ovale wallikeri]
MVASKEALARQRHRGDSPKIKEKSEMSEIGTKFGSSFLGKAPISLTVSVLYKNITGNTDADNAFLYNTQESVDIFIDRTENYISYQPM